MNHPTQLPPPPRPSWRTRGVACAVVPLRVVSILLYGPAAMALGLFVYSVLEVSHWALWRALLAVLMMRAGSGDLSMKYSVFQILTCANRNAHRYWLLPSSFLNILEREARHPLHSSVVTYFAAGSLGVAGFYVLTLRRAYRALGLRLPLGSLGLAGAPEGRDVWSAAIVASEHIVRYVAWQWFLLAALFELPNMGVMAAEVASRSVLSGLGHQLRDAMVSASASGDWRLVQADLVGYLLGVGVLEASRSAVDAWWSSTHGLLDGIQWRWRIEEVLCISVVVALVATARLGFGSAIREHIRRKPICRGCGYPLRAQRALCPECGPLPPRRVSRPRANFRRRRRSFLMGLCWAAAGVLAAAAMSWTRQPFLSLLRLSRDPRLAERAQPMTQDVLLAKLWFRFDYFAELRSGVAYEAVIDGQVVRFLPTAPDGRSVTIEIWHDQSHFVRSYSMPSPGSPAWNADIREWEPIVTVGNAVLYFQSPDNAVAGQGLDRIELRCLASTMTLRPIRQPP